MTPSKPPSSDDVFTIQSLTEVLTDSKEVLKLEQLPNGKMVQPYASIPAACAFLINDLYVDVIVAADEPPYIISFTPYSIIIYLTPGCEITSRTNRSVPDEDTSVPPMPSLITPTFFVSSFCCRIDAKLSVHLFCAFVVVPRPSVME